MVIFIPLLMDFARITAACADSEPYEYGYEDPEHECYEFDLPIFADRLPTKISCKRPCGIIYKRHGERCERVCFLKNDFFWGKNLVLRVYSGHSRPEGESLPVCSDCGPGH